MTKEGLRSELMEILDCELVGLEELTRNKRGILLCMDDGSKFQLSIESLTDENDEEDDEEEEMDDDGDEAS